MKKLMACILTALPLSGCGLPAAKYVDISGEAGIRDIVSTSRTTTTDLLLLGVDSYPSRKRIEDYTLVPSPGFDGPEVLSRSVLPQGSQLHLLGAQRCTNCSPETVRLHVRIDGIEKDAPVYIDMVWLDLLE